MKKTIWTTISALMLSACGGSDHSDEQVNQLNEPNTFYAFINHGSGVGIGLKKYHLNENQELLIQNEFTGDIVRNYATADGFSTTQPPQIDSKAYIIGENASFDGKKLQYSVSHYNIEKPLILTKTYKQIDVSGRLMSEDINNPVGVLYSTITGEILATNLGIPRLTNADTFPKGSICWQQQSLWSNQDYIEFEPPIDNLQVFENAEVDLMGNWNRVDWIRYKNLTTFPNTKLTIDGKDYWGLYYSQQEERLSDSTELKCDLMNEIAYKVVNLPFEKFN